MGTCCSAEREKPKIAVAPKTRDTVGDAETVTQTQPAVSKEKKSIPSSKPTENEKANKGWTSSRKSIKSQAAFDLEQISGLEVQQIPVASQYRIQKRLYCDRLSTVFCVEHVLTNQKRIMKRLRKSKKLGSSGPGSGSASPEEEFKAEVAILTKIDHPHIMAIYEMFEDADYFYLISELLTGGSVLDYVSMSNGCTEAEIAKIISQVLSGLSHCHAKGIVHRNLQADNLILQSTPNDTQMQVKITGFGAACLRTDQEKLNKRVGSALYVPPEAFKRRYSEKSDVWSCGVVLYLLLSGSPPFFAPEAEKIFFKIRSCAPDFPPAIWSHVSPEANNLIRSMLVKKPRFRPTASECLNHPWIKKMAADVALHAKPVQIALSNLRSFRNSQYLKQSVLSFVSTQVTLSGENAQLIEAFRAVDSNNDGVLSRTELAAAYEKFMPGELAASVVEEVMKSVDFDGNGFIDYSEFIIAAASHKSLLTPKKLKLSFSLFDRDNSGYISVKELIAALRPKSTEAIDDAWDALLLEVGCQGTEMDFAGFSRLMLLAVGN